MAKNFISDERFAHMGSDVRFRSDTRRGRREVKIDDRFNAMFTDKRFAVSYTADERGKSANYSTNHSLKNYYNLPSPEESSEEEDESDSSDDDTVEKVRNELPRTDVRAKKTKKKRQLPEESSTSDSEDDARIEKDDEVDEEEEEPIDYSRGAGNVLSSSSDDSSTDEEEGVVHPWNELAADAPTTAEGTRRLALCNMDWDCIDAKDLFVLLNSFLPVGGAILSLKIYVSEFGKKRLEEENLKGPKELVETVLPEDAEKGVETTESEEKINENLRIYQLNRLKYYYAVLECDSVATALHMYQECDSMEFESSSSRIDLRFIPDDMTFDDEPVSVADVDINLVKYRPKHFQTLALNNKTVRLTWDKGDAKRKEVIKRAFDADEIEDMDLKAYLASSSGSDEDGGNSFDLKKMDYSKGGDEVSEESRIAKYRDLIKSLEDKEENEQDVGLEITWDIELKDKTEDLVQKKIEEAESTPWDKFLNNQKQKRRQKRLAKKTKDVDTSEDEVEDEEAEESDDERPSAVDRKKPSPRRLGKEGKEKTKQKKETDAQQQKDMAELELLLMDEDRNTHHFNVRKLLEEDPDKKKKPEDREMDTGFQMKVNDPRFEAIFDSHLFHIDPRNPHFKSTSGMSAILEEKEMIMMSGSHPRKRVVTTEETEDKRPSSAELASLVRSVKSKTDSFVKRKRK